MKAAGFPSNVMVGFQFHGIVVYLQNSKPESTTVFIEVFQFAVEPFKLKQTWLPG